MTLYRSPDYQTSFEAIGLLVEEKKFNIDFQDGCLGGHFGFPIGMFFCYFLSTSHLDTSNEVSSQLAFRLRRRKSKQISTWLPWWSS